MSRALNIYFSTVFCHVWKVSKALLKSRHASFARLLSTAVFQSSKYLLSVVLQSFPQASMCFVRNWRLQPPELLQGSRSMRVSNIIIGMFSSITTRCNFHDRTGWDILTTSWKDMCSLLCAQQVWNFLLWTKLILLDCTIYLTTS